MADACITLPAVPPLSVVLTAVIGACRAGSPLRSLSGARPRAIFGAMMAKGIESLQKMFARAGLLIAALPAAIAYDLEADGG